jgi:hypothetical protein
VLPERGWSRGLSGSGGLATSSISEGVARLEKAAAEGRLPGRDLEVIAMQVARAEAKILRAMQASPFRSLQA